MECLERVRSISRRTVRAALLASTMLPAFALSQTAAAQQADLSVPTIDSPVDENGVNVATGQIEFSAEAFSRDTTLSIGDVAGGLNVHNTLNTYYGHNFFAGMNIYLFGGLIQVTIGPRIIKFPLNFAINPSNSNQLLITSSAADGSVLSGTFTAPPSGYAEANIVLTSGDGSQITFADSDAYADKFIPAVSQTKPSGEIIKYNYRVEAAPLPCNPYTCHSSRLQSVESNHGYQIKFLYASNSPSNNDYGKLNSITAINLSSEYCEPLADSCTLMQPWPSLQPNSIFSGSDYIESVTDPAGRETKYKFGEVGPNIRKLTGVRRPGSVSDDVSISWSSYKVSSITQGGQTFNYSYSTAGDVLTTVVSDSSGTLRTTTARADQGDQGVILSSKDALNRTTTFTRDSAGQITEIVYPQGNKAQFARDVRGNITEIRKIAKAGSGLADIVTTASFDATCTNLVTCNKPIWTRDALGNQTDYTYDSATGQVLTVTLPAATTGGTRPKTTYTYTSSRAWYKNASGTLVQSPDPVSKLTAISTCASGATCSGTAAETRTEIAYQAGSSSAGSNLLPTTTTTRSGDNAVSATQTVSYDAIGNAIAVDGPISGTGDTTTFRFDALRRPIGAIGPDPDGSGSLVNAAQRVTYDTRGRAILVEQGTTAGQSDTAWTNFTAADSVSTAYDAADRAVEGRLKVGSTTFSAAQYNYDSRGRLNCSVVRMNPSLFSSLPSDACSLGTQGSFGPDRITKRYYNAAGDLTSATTAYGTSAATTEATEYTSNGKVAAVIDAESNRTSMTYDGHDQLVTTNFPNLTKGSGTSSSSDYEQLTYNGASQVTSRRLRDGRSIGFTYDNLGRIVTQDLPGSDPDISVQYDLLGRVTSLADSAGKTFSSTYDALGRPKTDTGPLGTFQKAYDAGGRLTTLTYPDSFSVSYDYDNVGAITKIRENGATSGIGVLASYTYDSLGRRVQADFGNGTSRSYGYDATKPSAWLDGLRLDLGGSSSDLTVGRVAGSGTAIGWNPASQISSLVRSNDAYAYTGRSNATRSYTANGLNQYTVAAGGTMTYDALGNLASANGVSYSYNSLNQLMSVSGGGYGGTMTYDPLGRLDVLTAGATTTRFLYAGSQLTGEYNASNVLQRRYVHGPGIDEPIVWYEGSGTSDRRWLQSDERGSVVAVNDASGVAVALNRYDEYGVPQGGVTGRFAYTGQTAMPEVGLYYYKARFYSPVLGRFLQTDPIGYGDGLNWYNYVGSDPVNRTDPTGAFCVPAAVYSNAQGLQPSVRQNCGFMFSDSSVELNPFATWDFFKNLSSLPIKPAAPVPQPQNASHRYNVQKRLTGPNSRCSASQVSSAVNRNFVPGNYGNHSNGRSYNVYLAGGIFSLGSITFRSNSAGTVFQNVTNSDHMLRWGSVMGTISGDQASGFSISIVGEGSNTSSLIAWGNQNFGEAQFNVQAIAAGNELGALCGR